MKDKRITGRHFTSPDNHGVDLAAWPDFEDDDQ